jgi:hypothetical protein
MTKAVIMVKRPVLPSVLNPLNKRSMDRRKRHKKTMLLFILNLHFKPSDFSRQEFQGHFRVISVIDLAALGFV